MLIRDYYEIGRRFSDISCVSFSEGNIMVVKLNIHYNIDTNNEI